ncbi:sensor histidine kinase [Actinomycetota bacterium Odt1-20B]
MRIALPRLLGPPGPRDVRAGVARTLRVDALFALVCAACAVFIGLRGGGGDSRAPDAVGWTLLLALHVPLVFRRRAPLGAFVALAAFVAPYHALNYNHNAPMAASMLALFTVAMSGRPLRTVVVGAGVIGVMLGVKFGQGIAEGREALRITGWIVSFLILGVYVRVHRQYVASVVERAERAERTREEEARRRVAEERLRVARDLHDLLAHSITLVGVQTSVAAHVLAADPDRLDRAAVAKALEDISETCRTARGELRATLEVLRSGTDGDVHGGAAAADESRGPLPGLDGIADLAESARTAGAAVEVDVQECATPPAVGVAAYRIVQEALTNAVRHAGGPGLTIRVGLRTEHADAGAEGAGAGGGVLRVTVCDDGRTVQDPSHTPGFGLLGMRERARSVGGTLEAGPREEGGFMVSAVLPLVAAGAAVAAAGPGGAA